MEGWQKSYINHKLEDLIKNTICDKPFLTKLQADGLVSYADVQILESFKIPFATSSELYTILQTRTRGFEGLIKHLHNSKQTGACDILLDGYTLHKKEIPKSLDTIINEHTNSLLQSTVWVQGKYVNLSDVLSLTKGYQLDIRKIDVQTRNEILSNNFILWKDCIPRKPQIYVRRTLTRKWHLREEILKSKLDDIFLIQGILRNELVELVKPETARSSSEIIHSINVKFVLLESEKEVRRLSELKNGQNMHHLLWERQKLIWVQTFGKVKKLQEFVQQDTQSINEDEVPQLCGKHVCISGNTGMGKTILLQHLARVFSDCNKSNLNQFIFYFGFNEFCDKLEDVRKANSSASMKDAIIIAIAKLTAPKKLDINFFTRILANPKVHIRLFLDGFNQKVPFKLSSDFFSTIRRKMSKASLYVTTRSSNCKQLESLMDVLAVSLNPLIDKDKEILSKSLEDKGSQDSHTLTEYLVDIMVSNNQKISDPLTYTLLEKVYLEKKGNKNEVTLSYSELSKAILEKQLERVLKDNDYASTPNIDESRLSITMYKHVLILIALDLVFPNYTTCFNRILNCNHLISMCITPLLDLGILYSTKSPLDTSARFCNRTVAECLLAEFFVDILGQHKAFSALDLHLKIAFVKFLFEEVLETRKTTKQIMRYNLPNISAEVTMYTFVHSQIASFLNTSITVSKILHPKNRESFFLRDFIEIKLAKHSITNAIQACVECSYTSVLNFAVLLSKKIDTMASLIFDNDLLISAAMFSDLEFNTSIMNLCHNREIEIQKCEGKATALQAAMLRGYFNLVQLLKSDEFGRDNFLLHFLVVGSMHDNSTTIADKIDIMEQILKENPQCNVEKMEGEAPVLQVHIHEKLIEPLLNKNNVNDCNKKGDNVLDMFLKRGEKEKIDQETLDRVLIMLREKGFNLQEKFESKMSEIFRYGNVGYNTIKILEGAGEHSCFNQKQVESLLFRAVRTFQSRDCIESLLKEAHNIFDTNIQGQTILHASVIHENCDIVDYLISISLDTHTGQESVISHVDNDGNTALHVAFLLSPSLRAEEIQDKLMQADPKLLDVKNKAKMTPLENALGNMKSLYITPQRLKSFETKKVIKLEKTSKLFLDVLATNKHFVDKIKNKSVTNFDYINLVVTLHKELPPEEFENKLSKIKIDFNGKIQDVCKLPIMLETFANSIQHSESAELHQEVFFRCYDKQVVEVLQPIQNEKLSSYTSRTLTVYSDFQTQHTQTFISEDKLVENVDNILSRFCYLESEAFGITCCMKSLACKIQTKYTDRIVVYIDIMEFLNFAKTHFLQENSSINFLQEYTSFNFLVPFLKFISVSAFSRIVVESLALNNITKFELFIDGLGNASSKQLEIAKHIVVSLTDKLENARVIAGSNNPEIFNVLEYPQDICTVNILPFDNKELANFLWHNLSRDPKTDLESIAQELVYTSQNSFESLLELAAYVFPPVHVLEFKSGNCNSGNISDATKTDTSLTDLLVQCLKCMISKNETNSHKSLDFFEVLKCFFPDFLIICKDEAETFEPISRSVKVFALRNRYMSNCVDTFIKKFWVVEFFMKYFFETQLPNQKNVLKYILNVLFSTSITKSICFETMEGIGFKVDSFNLKCRRFFHSDFIEIINAQIKTRAQYNIPEEVVECFFENVQPKRLLRIVLACLFHNHLFLFGLFYNIFENIQKKDVIAYRYYFCEELKPCFLINVATAHSSINLVNMLFSFYSEIFQFDLNAYFKKLDSKVLSPLYLALHRGSFEATKCFLEALKLKQIYGRGLLHICLYESKNQPMYTISSKKKIIKLLLQKDIELSEEVWNSTKPLLMRNVHVDLMLQLLEEGTNHRVTDLKRNNVAHCGALYFDVVSFIKLYTKLSNLSHFKDIFLAVNSNNRTPIHEAILRFPSLSWACVKHVIDNTKFEILKFRQDKIQESFFFVDIKNQPKPFQRNFYQKAIEWYLKTLKPSMLLDAVTRYGNPVMVAELLTFKQFENIKGDRLGNNILHLTAIYFKPEDFHKQVKQRLIRDQKYLIEAKNTEGISPLHLAVSNKNVNLETIKMLRLYKVDLHSKYKNGNTILETAKKNGCDEEIVKYLEGTQDTSGCKLKFCYRVH